MTLHTAGAIVASSTLFLSTTLFFGHRLVYELRRRKHTTPRTLSLLSAVIAWMFLAASYGMLLWTSILMVHGSRKKEDPTYSPKAGVVFSTYPALMRAMFYGVWTLSTSIWLTKASFVFMYFGLPGVEGQVRMALLAASAYILATYIGVVVPFFLWCRPLSIVWEAKRYITEQVCNPTDYITDTVYLKMYTVLNTTSDGVVILIPLVIFHHTRSKLSRKDSRAIVFLCGLGVLTVTVAATRTIVMVVANEWTPGLLQTSELLAFAECCAALIACCLPAVRAHLNARAEERRRQEGNLEVGKVRTKKKYAWDSLGSAGLDSSVTESRVERVERVGE